MRKKTGTALIGFAVAGTIVLATGGGRGYTESPIGRQKLCAHGTVTDCGSVQGEPERRETHLILAV
jgi:chitin-binding protein